MLVADRHPTNSRITQRRIPAMYYLYVKTHNKTGLKYLGKTTKENPHTYHGSGKIWIRHLKKHGYDYKTEIFLATENEKELKETGIFFSRLWNIVESKEWANLMEEKGDGIDSNIAKRINEEKVKNGTHHWQGDGSFQRSLQIKKIENGTHHFLGGDLQKRVNAEKVKNGTHNFFFIDRSHVSEHNKKMVKEGTHPFLGKKLNEKMLSEGRHSSQRPECMAKTWEANRKRIENGSHEFANKTACRDISGDIVYVNVDEYKSQTGPIEERKYAHINSKEGRRRKQINLLKQSV